MVRLLWVVLSVGKVEFGVRMGGMVVVGSVLAGGLGLGNTVVGLVGVLIGLLHLGRCLGAGIVVGLSEGGICSKHFCIDPVSTTCIRCKLE